MITKNIWPLLLAVLLAAGCMRATPVPQVRYGEAVRVVSSAAFTFEDDLDGESLQLALDRSLNYYNGAGRDKTYHLGEMTFPASHLRESLLTLRDILRQGVRGAELKKQLTEKFDIYQSAGTDGGGAVVFTGYFEPLLEGSLVRTEKYRYPLYRVPPDLINQRISRTETKISRLYNGESVPYYSRRDIDKNKILQGRSLELIWVDNPVDLFFLHIQGSGKIRLADGSFLTVSATSSNGRPFRSVARHMLDNGIIQNKDASYRNIKRLLKDKSDEELYDILSYNERCIFFRFVEKDPIGALGEPVTPGRTIATDPQYFPEGAPAFIRLSKPVLDKEGNLTPRRISFSRFVFNQDKGSAIKGPGRVDLFCGFGAEGELMAGSLKETGELYFLIKK